MSTREAGEVKERVVVPAREGRGVRIEAGQSFRVVDEEGRQCGDLFAFNADDVDEYASAEHTRVHVNRLFPRPGEHFVTNKRRPILLFESDDTPGVHDMLIAACDPARFAGLGVNGWHASCQENLQQVMADLGHARVEVPQPINLFTNVRLTPELELEWLPALTEPGDSVTFRAELDCHIVVSACPQDIVEINDRQPGPLAIELLA
jgi:uncharacterized protein YcgI (DUF1989 family)